MLNFSIIVLLSVLIFSQSFELTNKPRFWKKAESARWLANSNLWGTLSTTSVHLKGRAWGQPKSFVDGVYTVNINFQFLCIT